MGNKFNIGDIQKMLEFLGNRKNNEIRCISPRENTSTAERVNERVSWVVNNNDETIKLVEEYHGKRNIYIGLNERKGNGISDVDVEYITNIGHDVDVHSGNKDDLKKAEEIVLKIKDDYIKSGYKEPLIIFSGHGYWVIHAIKPVKNTPENVVKIKDFGKRIKQKYEENGIIFDSGVYNPSRVVRLAGTLNVSKKENIINSFIINDVKRDEDEKLTRDIFSTTTCGEKINEVNLNNFIPLNLDDGELDNFFKIFLEETLPEGSINNTLEKNFAIWLRIKKADLKKVEEIYKNNGWGFGRLKGWLKKVDDGEIDTLNHGEIISWIRKYCPHWKNKKIIKTLVDSYPGINNVNIFLNKIEGEEFDEMFSYEEEKFNPSCDIYRERFLFYPQIHVVKKKENIENQVVFLTDNGIKLAPDEKTIPITEQESICLDFIENISYDDNQLSNSGLKILKKLFEDNDEDKELLQDIITKLKEYIYFSLKEEYVIVSLWIIHTFLIKLFGNTVYLWFTGNPGTGKSTAMRILNKLCFKSIFTAGATTAAAARSISINLNTYFADEFDKWNDDTRKEVQGIFNNGYSKDGYINKVVNDKKTGKFAVEKK